MLFGNELTRGEFDGIGVTVLGMGGAGNFKCRAMMSDSEGKFLGD